MGQPTLVAHGSAVNTTTTTLSLVAPTCRGNDMLVAVINTHDNTAITGQDARWVSVYSANNTTAQRFTVFVIPYILATDSGATFNFTVAGTTAALGRLTALRGSNGVGATSSSANASNATITWATITPGAAINSILLAVFSTGVQTGSDGGLSAGTPPTPLFNTAEYYSAGTTDAIGMYIAYGGVSTATGSRTMNNTSAAVNTGVMIEILGTSDGSGSNGGKAPAFGVQQPRTR